MKRKKKSSAPKVTTYDTYNDKDSAGDRISTVLTIGVFLVTWLVFGAAITFWLTDKGMGIFPAIILGVIGGFIVNVLAWIICRSGFMPMM